MAIQISRLWEFRPRDRHTQGWLQRALSTDGRWYLRSRVADTWPEWTLDARLAKWNPPVDVILRDMECSPWTELPIPEEAK
jgi:hypothetical protein